MHANFHIFFFSSANMAFSLAFAQTARAFLFLFLALAPLQEPFLSFAQLLLPFLELSFPSHWQVGEHSKTQTSSQSQKCNFIPTRTGWVINPNKERTLRTNLITATTQEPPPKIVQTQTCSQNTTLLIAHMPT